MPHRSILTPVICLLLGLCLLGTRTAHADGNLRGLRFRAGEAAPLLESPASFSHPRPQVDIVFEARGEEGGTVQVTVRGLGGIVLASASLPAAAPDWQARTFVFEGRKACGSVVEGLRAGWQGSRADAERLANARAGHQEYLLQVNARIVTLRSLQTLAEGLDWDGGPSGMRQRLDLQLDEMELLVVRARALPASDIESLKLLAQDMIQVSQAALQPAQDLAAAQAEACPAGMSLPEAGGAAYDVTLSQGGFPALAGEFRVRAAPRIYLPIMQRP